MPKPDDNGSKGRKENASRRHLGNESGIRYENRNAFMMLVEVTI